MVLGFCLMVLTSNFYSLQAPRKKWVKVYDFFGDFDFLLTLFSSFSSKVNPDGKLKRAWVQFCFDPIAKVFDTIMKGDQAAAMKLVTSMGVKLNTEEKNELGKVLLKTVMSKWLPAADALLEMIVVHLPSPVKAQGYRYNQLYEGPEDDPAAIGIRDCDPKV